MSLLSRIGWRRPLLGASVAVGMLAAGGLAAPAKAQFYGYPYYAGYCNPYYYPYGCGYGYPYYGWGRGRGWWGGHRFGGFRGGFHHGGFRGGGFHRGGFHGGGFHGGGFHGGGGRHR